jgi:hypothetical protein
VILIGFENNNYDLYKQHVIQQVFWGRGKGFWFVVFGDFGLGAD